MKIEILVCCAGLRFSYFAGETVEADDTMARDLIQAGYAKVLSGQQTSPPTDPPKEEKTDGKSDNSTGGGTGNADGVSGVDAGIADQPGAGTDGKQPAKSGT